MYRRSFEFSTRDASGLISEPEDSNGDSWTYGTNDVEAIVLPSARLRSSDGSFESSVGECGCVSYPRFPEGSRSESLTGDFEGRIYAPGGMPGRSNRHLGSGGAVGFFKLGHSGWVMTRSASHASRRRRLTRARYLERGPISGPDPNGDIDIAARDSDGDPIKLSASELFTDGSACVSPQRQFSIARDLIERPLQVLSV